MELCPRVRKLSILKFWLKFVRNICTHTYNICFIFWFDAEIDFLRNRPLNISQRENEAFIFAYVLELFSIESTQWPCSNGGVSHWNNKWGSRIFKASISGLITKNFFREKLFELQRNSFFFESEISLFATKFLCIYPETPVSFELYQIPNGFYLNFQLISWHNTYTRSGYIYFVISGPFSVELPIKNAPNKILWYRKIRCQILGAFLALFELSLIAYQTLQPKRQKWTQLLRLITAFLPSNQMSTIEYECLPSYSRMQFAHIANIDELIIVPKFSMRTGFGFTTFWVT